MESPITAAARAPTAGDPLTALKRVALRDEPPALALRGIAMAQIGDLARAKLSLRRATRGFGPADPCRHAAWAALAARGDRANAARATGN